VLTHGSSFSIEPRTSHFGLVNWAALIFNYLFAAFFLTNNMCVMFQSLMSCWEKNTDSLYIKFTYFNQEAPINHYILITVIMVGCRSQLLFFTFSSFSYDHLHPVGPLAHLLLHIRFNYTLFVVWPKIVSR
jgi:hypothetical protein